MDYVRDLSSFLNMYTSSVIIQKMETIEGVIKRKMNTSHTVIERTRLQIEQQKYTIDRYV